MGLFDTVILSEPIPCPSCGHLIADVQTKELEILMQTYETGDVVGHAEDLRILRVEAFCDREKEFTGVHVYLPVFRGILLPPSQSFASAKAEIDSLGLSRVTAMYRDLYRRFRAENRKVTECNVFLSDIVAWFTLGPEERKDTVPFNKTLLISPDVTNAADPLTAIRHFLEANRVQDGLDDLARKGHLTLNVSYRSEATEGQPSWTAYVSQDDVNRYANLDWTWVVESKEEIASSHPRRRIVVDQPFSLDAIRVAIEKWLVDNEYEFSVRIEGPNEPSVSSGETPTPANNASTSSERRHSPDVLDSITARRAAMMDILGIEKRVENDLDLADLAREGVSMENIGSVARALGLEDTEIVRVLSALDDPRSSNLGARTAEHVIKLAELAVSLGDFFENPEDAGEWLRNPARALGDRRPIDLLGSFYGTEMVIEVVNGLAGGVYL
jgi:putative toxin-antitoxin system antitoxin component (TIGR02293 family)